MAAGLPGLSVEEIIVVEGKYDAQRLRETVNATILTTNGFGIFKDKALAGLLRRLAAQRGVVVLTDADGAGLQIRNYVQQLCPPGTVTHAYIPPRPGVERRKHSPGRAGLLGVEAMPPELLLAALRHAGVLRSTVGPERTPIAKSELYEWGLLGREGSAARRRALLARLELPDYLSANKLCQVLGTLYSREELAQLLSDLGE